MSEVLSQSVLSWAADAVGVGAKVVAAKALREGRTGPWMLRIDHASGMSDVVLRVVVPGWIGEEGIATEAAALLLAEEHGLAAPRLNASDLDGRSTGVGATLETAVPGSSASPAKVSVERLREAAAAIARVHAAPSSLGATCRCGSVRPRSTTTRWRGAGQPCTRPPWTTRSPPSSRRCAS